MILLLLGVFAVIALTDYPVLIQGKRKKELATLTVFYLLAFVLALLLFFNVKLPSPIQGAQYIIKDILHFSYG